MDDFERFVEKLQEEIFEDTRRAYGEAGFQRWRHPLYQGRMANADAQARVKGTCGDTMEIFLKFEKGCVKAATYTTDGCGASTVCGSFAAELALGKNPDELADITGDVILQKIGRFPEEDEHCAFLAAATLQQALENYMRY